MITAITKHPPHYLIKNNIRTDKIKDMKRIDKDIGHVVAKSEIDSSMKSKPISIDSDIIES